MNDTDINFIMFVGYTTLLIVVSSTLGFKAGSDYGTHEVQKEAVRLGFAHYTGKLGEPQTTFTWQDRGLEGVTKEEIK